MQCVEQCDGANPVRYEQPVWQSLNMFIGELGCTYWFYLSYHIISYLSIHPSIYLSPPTLLLLAPTNERTGTPQVFFCSSNPPLPPRLRLAGFIPVLYTLAFTRWKKSRTRQQHAPPNRHNEADEETLLPASTNTKPRGKSLRGTNVLVMWLPALCDLSGTTVRLSSTLPRLAPPRLLPFFPSLLACLPSCHLRSIRTELAE